MCAGSVPAHNGLAVIAQTPLAQVAGPIDTLLVTGGLGMAGQLGNRRLIEGLPGWSRPPGELRRSATEPSCSPKRGCSPADA